jgi:hypothetical protein
MTRTAAGLLQLKPQATSRIERERDVLATYREQLARELAEVDRQLERSNLGALS